MRQHRILRENAQRHIEHPGLFGNIVQGESHLAARNLHLAERHGTDDLHDPVRLHGTGHDQFGPHVLRSESGQVERKLEMTELEQLNANALNGIRKALTVVPENLTQLLDLAKALYPDRIVILPDAYRSAKKFDGILTEEWEILVATATTLWDLCFKETVNDRLGSEFKKRTGYELARGESGTTCAMPNLMKLRKRMYKGKEVDISPHIKGRNVKTAFRLHFYIDRDEEKIVIGHAGEHMNTAGTPRR